MKKFLLLTFLLSLLSCGDNGDSTPTCDVECAENQQCVNGVCLYDECKTHSDCSENSTKKFCNEIGQCVTDICAEIDCSKMLSGSHCFSEINYPFCVCNTGYDIDYTENRCVKIPECEGDNFGEAAQSVTIPFNRSGHLCTNIWSTYKFKLNEEKNIFITISSSNIDLIYSNIYSQINYNNHITVGNKKYITFKTDGSEEQLTIDSRGIINDDYILDIKTECEVDEQCKILNQFSSCNVETGECVEVECIDDNSSNTPFDATEITLPFEKTDGVICNSLGDWYKISLNKNDTIVFETPKDEFGKMVQFYIYNEINSNWGIHSYQFAAPETGIYYIFITHDYGSTKYKLKIDYKQNICNTLNCSSENNEICDFDYKNGVFDCLCDVGYYRDSDGKCINVCENIECGDNSTCQKSGEFTTECLCDSGYTNYKFTPSFLKKEDGCVSFDDFCNYIDCSGKENTHCEKNCGDGYGGCYASCECDEGYYFSSITGICEPKEIFCQQCESKDNFKCYQDDYVYCDCKEGFVENDNGDCIAIEIACESLNCGANSHCNIINSYNGLGYYCICDDGYFPFFDECVISECQDDSIGNSFENATEIDLPYSEKNYSCPGKPDIYKLNLSENQGIILSINLNDDYIVEIYNSDKEKIEEFGNRFLPFNIFIPQSDGVFYLKMNFAHTSHETDYYIFIK
ncbi:hypothetical protein JXR93_08065 [bacterium]|nr:hypothetical protein [bacterium]